jgi:hypothetical protein
MGQQRHRRADRGREFLTANKEGTWLALAATAPFARRSCGYVGTTDGWQDLANNFGMDDTFAAAPDGNIALTGELDLSRSYRFTLGVGFGNTLHRAQSRPRSSRSPPPSASIASDSSVNGIVPAAVCIRSENQR